MASRRLRSRNEQIRQIFAHLRKVERRETAYCLEQIEANYHLGPDRIYQILAEPAEPAALENPSAYYQSLIKQL